MFQNLFNDVTDPAQKLELELFGEIVEENQLAAFRLKNKLVELRKAKGLSQEQLAERMGVSQQTVQKFERYHNDPKLSTLLRYANYVFANLNLDAKPHHQTEWKQTTPKLSVQETSTKPTSKSMTLNGWNNPNKIMQEAA